MIAPTQVDEPELTGPRFISSALMGQAFPPNAMVISILVLQAAMQTACQEETWVVEKRHTEPVKATAEGLGVGDLGIDRWNGGRRAANERRTGVKGNEITRRQGDGLVIDRDP